MRSAQRQIHRQSVWLFVLAAAVTSVVGCQEPGAPVLASESVIAPMRSVPLSVAGPSVAATIEVSDIETHRGNGAVDGVGVIAANIRNAGTRPASRVSVEIAFLNDSGRVVRRELYSPVATYNAFDLQPLLPNETRAWSAGFWDIPEDWTGAVKLTVAVVELS